MRRSDALIKEVHFFFLLILTATWRKFSLFFCTDLNTDALSSAQIPLHFRSSLGTVGKLLMAHLSISVRLAKKETS